MRLDVLPEPDLEFGAGHFPDIRFGLRDYGPVVIDTASAPKMIKVGFVGTPATIQKVRQWMTAARVGVPATPSKKPKFRPPFPGFSAESPFRCDWESEPRFERALRQSDISRILGTQRQPQAVKRAVDMFMAECDYLTTTAKVDVIICAPPIELLRHLDSEVEPEETSEEGRRPQLKKVAKKRWQPEDLDFHDVLKAHSLTLKSPIQFIRPATYDETVKDISRRGRKRHLQDPATRAWNFFTALYYKAGGTPWRLLRRSADQESCFLGISFYFTPGRQQVHTSVAQVFNERGEGMILRGGKAKKSKLDRQPHLSGPAMKALVVDALKNFEREHDYIPPRVVIHKTSSFSDGERRGCEAALKELGVAHRDLLVIRESNIRLFRYGAYPPLRGTYLELDAKHILLYTRGSVPFFEMYPGQYVPRALEIELVETEQSAEILAQEILALTKMNWNNTQFDSELPITVRAAKQVGSILKHATRFTTIQPAYAFYM